MPNPVLTREFEKAKPAGPITEDRPLTMTVRSTFYIALFLLGIVSAVGIWSYGQIEVGASFPSWFIWAVLGAFALAIVTVVRPQIAPITSPIYAAAQGLVLGIISAVYEQQFQGIVFQALLATVVTFFVMLVLFVTRTIKVTQRLRSVVIGATLGIALFYLVTILMSLFGVGIPLVWDSGPLGILFSAGVVVLAAFNLMLDFDLIERGVASGAPRIMNWMAAFGLMITIVWLYLELLRLIGKLRS